LKTEVNYNKQIVIQELKADSRVSGSQALTNLMDLLRFFTFFVSLTLQWLPINWPNEIKTKSNVAEVS